MLSVTYTPTDAEHLLVQQHVQIKPTAGGIGLALRCLFMLALLCGVYGAVGVVLPLAQGVAKGARVSSFGLAAIASTVSALLLVVWAYARHAAVRRALKAQRQEVLAPLTLQISERALSQGGGDLCVELRWPGIRQIKRVGDCAVFLTTLDTAHFVPARAFDSPDAFEQFMRAAREWHAAGVAAAATPA